MSKNVYRSLFRFRRFFFSTVFVTPLIMMAVLFGEPGHRPTAFHWWGLILPTALGVTLTSRLHELMHRPFSLLLPGTYRSFPRSHAVVISFVAMGCGLIGHWIDDRLSVFALASLASAGCSAPLPFEPNNRWAGSRILGALAWVSILAIVWQVHAIKTLLLDFPFVFGAVALVATVTNFLAAFSPDRRRARAMMPFTSTFSALFDPAIQALKNDEAKVSAGGNSRARWQLSTADGSLRSWIKAIRHERSVQQRRGLYTLLAGSAVLVIYVALNRGDAGLPGAVYQMFDPAEKTRRSFFPVILFWVLLNGGLCAPRPAWLYPISRSRRAQVTFAASGWQLAFSVSTVIAIMWIGTWLTSRWATLPFGTENLAMSAVAVLMMCPLQPLLSWCMLQAEVRADQSILAPVFLMIVVSNQFWPAFGTSLVAKLLSPVGLTALVLMLVATQLIYYWALKRFYRTEDLIHRKATV